MIEILKRLFDKKQISEEIKEEIIEKEVKNSTEIFREPVVKGSVIKEVCSANDIPMFTYYDTREIVKDIKISNEHIEENEYYFVTKATEGNPLHLVRSGEVRKTRFMIRKMGVINLEEEFLKDWKEGFKNIGENEEKVYIKNNVIKGNLLKEVLKNNENISLFTYHDTIWSDIWFEFSLEQLKEEKYYSLIRDNEKLGVLELEFLNTDGLFNKWY